MRSSIHSLIAVLVLTVLAASCCHSKAWFADICEKTSAYYSPGPGQFVNDLRYNDPLRALGAPDGAGEVYSPLNSLTKGYVVTLGDRRVSANQGWVVVGFSTPVDDDPRNPYGLDFIVFSNTYFVGYDPPYSDPTYRWQELAFVEISQDNQTWYLVRPSKLPAELIGSDDVTENPDTGFSTSPVSGYAEYTPSIHLPTAGHSDPFSSVSRTPQELYTVPDRPSLPQGYNTVRFDYVSGGGDAFDIADAVVEPATGPRGVPALDAEGHEIPANIPWFRYVRITDALQGDYSPGLGEISAEIDAVSACRPAISVGQVKQLAQGDYALITDAVVTAVRADCFYVESPSRAAGMRVNYDTSVAVDGKTVEVGDRVTLTGHVSKSGGRFMLPDPMFSCTAIQQPEPKPVGMNIRTLSSDMAYAMRVRTWGKVVDHGSGYCIIDDGGFRARAEWTDQTHQPPDVNAHVGITGVCEREEVTGSTVVLVNDPDQDITIY